MNLICVHSIPELCFEDIGKGLIIGLSNCWSGFAPVLFVGLKFLVSGTLLLSSIILHIRARVNVSGKVNVSGEQGWRSGDCTHFPPT